MTQLTENFSLAELTASDTATRHRIQNVPGHAELVELVHTATLLEDIRLILGRHPITVTSGFRNVAVNGLVGGARESAHVLGMAADFICPPYGTPREICFKLKDYVQSLDIDQLIYEGTWVHVGRRRPARHQVFTIQDGVSSPGVL